MKDLTTQTPIKRSLTVPSKVPGFPDKELVLTITSRGIDLTEKGKSAPPRRMTWTQLVHFLYTYG